MTGSKHGYRIAMLGQKQIPSRSGGIEVVVEALGSRMTAAGWEVTCIDRAHVLKHPLRLEDYQGMHRVQIPIPVQGGIGAFLCSIAATLYASFGPFDVLHFHGEGTCGLIGLPLLLGKTCVVTIHGLDHQRAKWGRLAKWYLKHAERMAARFADQIIVLSRGMQTYFEKEYARSTLLIPNAPEPMQQREPEGIQQRFSLGPRDYFLYCARLVPEKRADLLIRAFRGVNTERKLVIAGEGETRHPYDRRLRQMAAGDPRICFTGFVEGELLEELYSNAYAYVLPSDVEGMPIALLEAASMGNCCITSRIEENTQILGEAGFSFPPGDLKALRRILQKAADDPQQVEVMRRKTRQLEISRFFRWDEITSQTLQVYEACRKKKKKKRR